MMLSTDELKQLLNQATPGLWTLHKDDDGDPEGTFIHDEHGHMCIAIVPQGSGSDYREQDLTLAAHSRELAAEAIRLRTFLEGLRKDAARAEHGSIYAPHITEVIDNLLKGARDV